MNRVTTGLIFLALSVLLSASCSSKDEPAECAGKGSYTGDETCTKMVAAVDAKCGAGALDCPALIEPQCKKTNKFCKEGVDKGVADVTAAADCDGAKKVTFAYVCF